MRFQRVLFIIPNLKWVYGYPKFPHLGVGYICELLEQYGVKCGVLDMTLGIKLSKLAGKIREFDPDLIGVTLYSYRHYDAYQLIRQIKQITERPVVIGGPHVSLMKGKTLAESGADLAVKYEGEYPLLEICQGKPREEIDNLIYRDGEGIKENPSRPFIDNLDDLPFPKYSSFKLGKYGDSRSIAIISSRGCPYQCIYCSVKTTMGRGFRPRSPESIISELKYWYSRGYRHFDFNDDSFNVNKQRVYEICDLIEKENFAGIFLSCGQGMRLDRVDRPLLKKMKEAGFYRLGFGVESFNDRILQSIKKGETIEQIEEGVKIACELGYDVQLSFMLGFPGETWMDIQNSLNFSLKYPVTVAAFNIIPYPGTELLSYLQENKLLLADPAIYLNEDMTRSRKILFRTDSMSIDERRKALELGARISRRSSQKDMERRLSRFGILGKVFAWLTCTKLMWFVRTQLDHYGPAYKLRLLTMKLMGLRKAY